MLSKIRLFLRNLYQRINEIGIRMALGAQRTDVVWLVMRETLGVLCIGSALGTGAAYAAARLISSMLYGLDAHDPRAIAVGIAIMSAVATLAAFMPARRASRVDPMTALRYE